MIRIRSYSMENDIRADVTCCNGFVYPTKTLIYCLIFASAQTTAQ